MIELDSYGIGTELRPDFCRDSFHDSYHSEGTRDVLIFTFTNSEWPLLLCLGCHLTRSLVPAGEGSKSDWASAYEKKERVTVGSVMAKRGAKGKCVLCGKEPETKVAGLRFCFECSKKVEGKL